MGCVQNSGVITQPNFHLSTDVQKTTKAMVKILSLGTFFPPKKLPSGVFSFNAN